MAKIKSSTKRAGRAGVYIRMSSDQQERSPAQQRAEVAKLAKREGYRIVAEFVDEGIYGDSGPDQRPGFKAMLEAAERGEFDVLLLWDTDRLGRFDSHYGGEYYRRLREANIRIITCTEGEIDLESSMGRIMQTIRQEASHEYVTKLAEKVVRGKLDNARNGNWNGGNAYHGMRRALIAPDGSVQPLDPGERVSKPGHRVRLVPGDPEAVAAVQYAFDRFASADLPLRALARELNAKGYPSPRGKGWTHGNVGRMLTTTAYVGTTRWGQTTKAKYYYASGEDITKRENGDKGRFESKQPEDMIVVEGTHQGIIDGKLFAKVQRKIDRRYRKRGAGAPSPRGSFPLSGLICCKHCGQIMRHETRYAKSRDGKPRSYEYHQFVCSTYGRYGLDPSLNSTCLRHTIDAERVTKWIVQALQKAFLGPSRDELVAEVRKQLKADHGSHKGDDDRLRSRLAELDQEVARLVKAVRTVDMPELLGELQTARSERDQVKAELERIGRVATIDDLDQEAERIAGEVWRLGESLTDADPPVVKELLQRVVSKVVCRWERYQTDSGATRSRLVGGDVLLRDSDLFSVFHLVDGASRSTSR